MRISTNTIYEAGAARLSDLQSALVRQQQQIASGRRMLTPADDPVAAARALEVSQAQSTNAQYGVNRQNAKDSLTQEESALQSATSLLQDVKTLVVNAGNGTLTDTDRRSIATQLQGQFDALLGLSNSQDGTGVYLFAGYQSTAQPFSQTSTGAVYNGDQGQRLLQVGPSQQLEMSDSGSAVFERNKTGNGVFSTAATVSNTGSGIVSSGSVVNAALLTGNQYNVTFSVPTVTPNAGNTGSLVLGSSVANASALTGSDYRIDYDSAALPAPEYSITRLSDNVVVYPGNAVFPPVATIDGLNFSTVSGLPPVAGTDSFLVQPQSTTYSIVDTTTATTLSTGNPYTSGQSIVFDGLQFDVQGTPADGDQFTVQPSVNQSVFTTLRDLIGVLNTPAGGSVGQARLTNGLNIAHNNLSNALDNILTVRSSVGSRLNQVDALEDNGSDKDLQYADTLSKLQDLDYTKAITQLTQQQTTLSAAQQSFVKISGLSLFNYL